jgi:L,D-peptidoglycan transpeptidase YkuD (ErfK/YbiS/YcfS/YnhG family)
MRVAMPFRILIFTLLGLLPLAAFQLPSGTRQCLVGTAAAWDSTSVTLRLYEKHGKAWTAIGQPWQARLGRNGLVWGHGMHPLPASAATKKEGDGRSPAGVFSLGGAWGYAAQIRKHPALPYRQVTSRDLWVEDPSSPDYNRNVILKREPSGAWEKKQQMKQGDTAHSLKLFIAHNAPPKVIPNAGSAIFFHVWRGGGTRTTAGCTTMEKPKLEWLISKIDPTLQPVYVLLTAADYEKFRSAWQLP